MSLPELTTARPVTITSAPAAAHTARWLTPVELTLLGAIWGGSFLFMRIAAADFGPFALVEVRLALGAVVLLPFLWRARSQFTPTLWLHLTWISAINSAIPFILFAWGAERAPAGIGAITNSMAVMFAALVAFIFYGERIGPLRAVGLLAGFVGVVVLASGKTAGASVAPAALAGTTAAFLYGIGVNVIRRHLKGIPAGAVAAATLTAASLLVLPFAVYTRPSHTIAVASWVSAILLGVLCTGTALRDLLPTHPSCRRAEGRDGNLSRPVVRGCLGVARSRGGAHTHNGSGSGAYPGRRRAESAAGRQVVAEA